MRRELSDRTGARTRILGLGSVLLLVVTAAALREPPEAPPEAPPSTPAPRPFITVPAHPKPLTSRFDGLFPPYPRARAIPMGRMEANGNPLEMAYFETPDPAGDVLEFYAREFRKRGHRIATEADGAGGGAISYYDAKRGALVAVTTVGVPGPEPRTQVFPSIVEAPEGIHLQARAPEFLPRPPGAQTMLRVDERNPDTTEASTTITEVAQGTPDVVAGFYRKQLEALGYASKQTPPSSHGVELLDYQKPGQRLSLSLSPVGKKGSPTTLVTLVLERTAATQESRP
ncbi:hypothetical protein FJV41_14220 [Myxococcus llanfairpwllgwyngyllgogerychwyrndrobwllllantysiliogogogochensis]|uniref:Uncharacterized protein n=1 Tax=Myxococcus llanfairpwllgwyngyllgogerychwyrndrobwllllantysiliogogogochensis TaxID=2590453 RepID=A0A540X245_9BACT|nr:hypothetical protein [Myxococcus llanfairpwllgwyngyllgogerychwyrndrobwllllantysiliogogogochensis]TQF15319.1 hypothetical protein FJV41_14220 [Myxococcus llanfairpwllgwyngyllgogerychwyrndrobwllllantysiliogogogochensis]